MEIEYRRSGIWVRASVSIDGIVLTGARRLLFKAWARRELLNALREVQERL